MCRWACVVCAGSFQAAVPRHANVTNIVGVVTRGDPFLLVISYAEHGSILSCLRNRTDGYGVFCKKHKGLLDIAREIAAGMAHLAGHGIIHRDLAARNVLIDSNLSCLIADFGMSRASSDAEASMYYRSSSGGVFPLRWTAPESIKSLIFTTKSDVWSFAITLVEVCQLGVIPYQDLSNESVMSFVKNGRCHPCPSRCPPAVYRIMLECMSFQPQARPQFEDILAQLRRVPHEDNMDVATLLRTPMYTPRDKGDTFPLLHAAPHSPSSSAPATLAGNQAYKAFAASSDAPVPARESSVAGAQLRPQDSQASFSSIFGAHYTRTLGTSIVPFGETTLERQRVASFGNGAGTIATVADFTQPPNGEYSMLSSYSMASEQADALARSSSMDHPRDSSTFTAANRYINHRLPTDSERLQTATARPGMSSTGGGFTSFNSYHSFDASDDTQPNAPHAPQPLLHAAATTNTGHRDSGTSVVDASECADQDPPRIQTQIRRPHWTMKSSSEV